VTLLIQPRHHCCVRLNRNLLDPAVLRWAHERTLTLALPWLLGRDEHAFAGLGFCFLRVRAPSRLVGSRSGSPFTSIAASSSSRTIAAMLILRLKDWLSSHERCPASTMMPIGLGFGFGGR
jgi:hypothetical protein